MNQHHIRDQKLLQINKQELEKKFIERDWEYVFDKAYQICDFLISQKFKVLDLDLKNDMIQECIENLWKKILDGKVEENRNMFSFIWKNSVFRILEILRKDSNRKRIAMFVSYDTNDFEIYKGDSAWGEKYKGMEDEI
jgi:hypothetical protein